MGPCYTEMIKKKKRIMKVIEQPVLVEYDNLYY